MRFLLFFRFADLEAVEFNLCNFSKSAKFGYVNIKLTAKSSEVKSQGRANLAVNKHEERLETGLRQSIVVTKPYLAIFLARL
jgi:hypothetical protein